MQPPTTLLIAGSPFALRLDAFSGPRAQRISKVPYEPEGQVSRTSYGFRLVFKDGNEAVAHSNKANIAAD